MTEAALLQAAATGDETSFGALVAPHRRALQAHCYRMLASVHDAEDAVQDTLLGAWRGVGRFERRSSVRSWLYAIATNVCLRRLQERTRRALPVDLTDAAGPDATLAPPLSESSWIEPYPDAWLDDSPGGPESRYEQREAIELAFIAALQLLPARQRAVLILRDVLGFSGAEVAEMLETTAASAYSLLQRAHATIDGRLPERSQQATLRLLGDRQLAALVDRYTTAWADGDVDAIAAMLTDGAALAMPPTPTWFRGRETVAAFLQAHPFDGPPKWRLLPTAANGQPAMGVYRRGSTGLFIPYGLTVLTLEHDRIDEITTFRNPSAPETFGLPAGM